MYYVAILAKILIGLIPLGIIVKYYLKLQKDAAFAEKVNRTVSTSGFKIKFYLWLPTICLFFGLVGMVLGDATDDWIERTKPSNVNAPPLVCIEYDGSECLQWEVSKEDQKRRADKEKKGNMQKSIDELACQMPIKPIGANCN